jgi:hypothetical protein
LEVHERKYRIGSAKVQADVSWARSSGAVGVVSPVGIRADVVDVAEWTTEEAGIQRVEEFNA